MNFNWVLALNKKIQYDMQKGKEGSTSLIFPSKLLFPQILCYKVVINFKLQ